MKNRLCQLLTFALLLALILPAGVSAADDIAINAVNFPDEVFRAYVSANFDTNRDGTLSAAECEKVTHVDVSGKGITSLAGIEYFPQLVSLKCNGNSLTSLDVRSNPDLQHLECANNQLERLDVTKNPVLMELYCNSNPIGGLIVTENPCLTVLSCPDCGIYGLNLKSNPLLTYLNCSNNRIRFLDLSSQDDLQTALLSQVICIEDLYDPSVPREGYEIDGYDLGGDITNPRLKNITSMEGGTIENGLISCTGATFTYVYDHQNSNKSLPAMKVRLYTRVAAVEGEIKTSDLVDGMVLRLVGDTVLTVDASRTLGGIYSDVNDPDASFPAALYDLEILHADKDKTLTVSCGSGDAVQAKNVTLNAIIRIEAENGSGIVSTYQTWVNGNSLDVDASNMGIRCYAFRMDGGALDILSGSGEGIRADNGVAISAGSLTVRSPNNKAIQTIDNDLTIGSEATLVAEAQTYVLFSTRGSVQLDGQVELRSVNSFGTVYAGKNVVINGGTIRVLSPGNAVNAGRNSSDGRIVFNDGCGILWPEDLALSSDGKQIVDVNGNPAAKVTLGAPVEYPVWVGTQQVSNGNMADVFGDGSVRYDPVSGTLTLAGYYGGGIYADRALKILVSAANSIGGSDVIKYGSNDYAGIYVNGNCELEIRDEASLRISFPTGDPDSDYSGIYVDNGSVSVSVGNGGTLTVKVNYLGISADSGIMLSGGGTLTVNAGNVGLFADRGNIEIQGEGTVTVTSDGERGHPVFLLSGEGCLLLNGSATVELSSGFDFEAAVYNNETGESPVGGDRLPDYNYVSGGPSRRYVKYERNGGSGIIKFGVLTWGEAQYAAAYDKAGRFLGLATFRKSDEYGTDVADFTDAKFASAVVYKLFDMEDGSPLQDCVMKRK